MPTEAETLAQAQAAARAGDYKTARDLLTPLAKSSPRAQKWLHQINERIAQEALAAKDAPNLAAPSAAPVAKPVARPKKKSRKGLWIGGTLGLFAIVGLLLYVFWWLPTTAKIDEIFQTVQLKILCREVFADAQDRLSVESFSDACDKEAESALVLYRDEVAYCLDQSQLGRLKQQFIECLIDNGFEFSGTWIGIAR